MTTSTRVINISTVRETESKQKVDTLSKPLGEYASVEPNNNGLPVDWGSPFPTYQNWIQAVSEAVYCIGSERNADRVIGRAYVSVLFYFEEELSL